MNNALEIDVIALKPSDDSVCALHNDRKATHRIGYECEDGRFHDYDTWCDECAAPFLEEV